MNLGFESEKIEFKKSIGSTARQLYILELKIMEMLLDNQI